ncbi:MAG: AmmeMemoRadiSam system protein B [Thermoplasmata archaeon]|mgnify:CR=1 FL=1|nr:MAG: AmmeMemoRadiSam system protein B [Thermoplasmata archaeon]
MHRKPVVAGHFYERKTERLIEEIKHCFLKGPGEIPEVKRGGGKIKGVVVPHAGYIYSGYVAAYVYREIARDGFPEKFIILGPNHHGYGAAVAIMTEGTWETPLGEIKIADDAEKYCRGIIQKDEIAHKYEHSIEVQLPFLQFLSQDFTFIPICFGWQDWETVREVGSILADAEDAIIIASSDFSHVNFSGFPTEDDIEEHVKKKDMMAIEEILQLNAEGLIEKVEKENITMCGYGAVAAMLEALKGRASQAKLLKYATSYDVEPGTYCVGYAAIVIE